MEKYHCIFGWFDTGHCGGGTDMVSEPHWSAISVLWAHSDHGNKELLAFYFQNTWAQRASLIKSFPGQQHRQASALPRGYCPVSAHCHSLGRLRKDNNSLPKPPDTIEHHGIFHSPKSHRYLLPGDSEHETESWTWPCAVLCWGETQQLNDHANIGLETAKGSSQVGHGRAHC